MVKTVRKEIEVKAEVENFDDVINRLEALGCIFAKPILQEDTVFFPPEVGPDDFKKGVNSLRIRMVNDKATLTLKQRQEVALSAIEKEVVVSDPKAMTEIIILLGFYEFIKLSKVRRTCHYKDYEICLDEIKDLGNYIEVEKMTDEESDVVQEELFQFLESLGIKRENRASRGYDILLYNKLHQTSQK